MIGIYSLTSPTCKVYIGQSWDIEKRITGYRTHLRCKQQVGISRSIEKYGFKQHVVKVLYELPAGVTQNVLDEFEIFFINQYKCAGVLLLNMKDGGSGGKPNEETLLKIKEARARQTPPTLGLKFSEETKERMRNAQKDRRFPEWAVEKGRETRRLNGVSEATKEKIRNRLKKNNPWNGKKHSDESKKKMSEAKIGNKINVKKVRRLDTGQVFDSISDAAESIGVSGKHLSYRLCKNRKTFPIFEYV